MTTADDDPVETVEGEVITFQTRAEFDAFRAGFDMGDRYGTQKDWSDGYRADDLVDVEFDEATLTIRERLATGAGDDDEDDDDGTDDGR